MFPILLEKIIILAVSVNQAAREAGISQKISQPVHQGRQPGNEIPCLKAKVV
ncbi:hypothetical protein [Nostoc sp.]|uniref:hypothetical protein n=1 Tax=Nostoc sp. TaxID=1180 RepID=UPI002FFC29E3